MKFSAQQIRKLLPIFGAVAIIIISITNVVIHYLPEKQQEVLAAVDPWEQEVEFWKEIVRLHPTYRDGYIELADLYLSKDLYEAAEQSANKALEIDPFSEKAKAIQYKIEE